MKKKCKYKLCDKKHIKQPLSNFHKDKTKSDGYHTYCKECRKRMQKEQYLKKVGNLTKPPSKTECEKKERRSMSYKKWRLKNKEARNEYHRKMWKDNPIYRISKNFSRRIRSLISKEGKNTITILDYTLDELKIHLENQFDPEMNWENYGSYWDVDHIIPVSHFNFKSIDDTEFKKCWALKNLQPLTKEENIKKSDNLNWTTLSEAIKK